MPATDTVPIGVPIGMEILGPAVERVQVTGCRCQDRRSAAREENAAVREYEY